MRNTDTITASKPGNTMSLQWEARTFLVVNGTVSPILFRQGGSDIPTGNSADFIIPAQSIQQIPVFGNQFAYGFATPTLLGEGSITSAKLTALDANEAVGNVGSTSTVQRAAYWEKERNPQTLGNFFADISVTSASPQTTITVYTCPDNRKARIASAQIEAYTLGWPASGTDLIVGSIEVPSLARPAAPSLVCMMQTLFTGIYQTANRSLSVEYFLNPGDQIVYSVNSAYRPTGIIYELVMNVSLTEFDF